MRRIYLLVAFFLLCVPFALLGQSHQLDSFRLVLKNSDVKDTSRILTLCDYAFALDANNDYDSILILARQASEAAQKLNYSKGLGRAYWLMGMANYYLDEIDSAESYLDKGLPFAMASNDIRELGRIYNSKANVARYRGNNALAIDLYFESLKLKEKNGDRFGEALTLNNIANVYNEQGDYNKALKFYLRSLKIRRELNREQGASMLLSTLAENYIKLGSLDSAQYFLNRALVFAKSTRQPWNLIHVYGALILYHNRANNPDSVLQYIKLGLKAAKEAKSKDREALMFLHRAAFEIDQNDFKEALAFADSALNLADGLKRKDYVISGTGYKSESLFGLKRFEEAYRFSKLFKQMSDSSRNTDFQKALQGKELEYELDKQKILNEKSRLQFEQDLKLSRWIITFAVALTLTLSGLVFIFYKNNQFRKRVNDRLQQKRIEIELKNKEILAQNNELQKQKEEIFTINSGLEANVQQRTKELYETVRELTRQNGDLEQFSFIVSHNIRAPIARIQGLLNLIELSPAENRESYHKLIRESSNHLEEVIQDLSKIINVRNNFALTKEAVNVNELVRSILYTLKTELDQIKGEVKIHFGDEILLVSVQPYLHSIFYNLISNAIKYRSPERSLQITIRGENTGTWCKFSISDNGRGIDLSDNNRKKLFGLYQRFHPAIEGKGFGLYLVKTQLESIGGSIEVMSEIGRGTEFLFTIPTNT